MLSTTLSLWHKQPRPSGILTNNPVPLAYYSMWKDGDITATDFARLVGVSRPTLYKYLEVIQNEKK